MASDIEPINNFETNNHGSKALGDRGRRRTTPRLAPIGRYDGERQGTWHPSDGLGRMPPSANADTTVAAVVDPYGNGKERVLATINRRVDILETERSHARISDAAYHNGRIVQEVFERANRLLGCNWLGGSGLDPAEARATKIEKSVENAERVRKLVERISARLGMIDTRLLRRVLGDRMTFAQCAALQGKAGDRGERYVAARFRDALEALSEAWTAKGKVQPAPGDRHAIDAATMETRQDDSLIAGASLERLLGELEQLTAERGRKSEIAERKIELADLRLRQGISAARRVNRRPV